MSFQSLDLLLQQADVLENKNFTKKSDKINLQTPFGLNDLMFDDNELYSCDQDITSSMSELNLNNQMNGECQNISDYISKHLSLLSSDEPKLSVVENTNKIDPKLRLSNMKSESLVNNIKSEDKINSQQPINNKGLYVKKYKIFRTKSLAKLRKSPLENPDSGLSLTLGRKYPKSSLNLMNKYLCNVLIKTRSCGFRFNTPSPDESVLSWMDIVRQMPNK